MKTEDHYFEPLKEKKMSIPIRVSALEKKQIEDFLKKCEACGLRLKLKPLIKKHIDEAQEYLKKHPDLKPAGGSEKSAGPKPKDTSAPGPEKTEDGSGSVSKKKKPNGDLTSGEKTDNSKKTEETKEKKSFWGRA